MDSRVRIEGAPPSPAEALELYRAVFVGPGEYVVKAQTHDENFEEWFLGALFRAAQRHYGDARAQIREALDRLLKLRGVKAPTGLGFDELHEALMDLSTASTASMVGIDVPQAVKRRLLTIGFTEQAILDFPAIAYRMGLIYRELASAAPVPFARLAARARAVPITDAENAAIDYARRRAGLWLRPIFDREGALWSAERELFPIRQRVTQALERRTAPREAARELQNTYRAAGIERDAERVIRTELAEASNRGAWAVESRTWSSDNQVFRQPSREACKGCLRLYLDPNGMPRLYAPRFVEEASAYPNTGGWRDWMPQIGPTHPNCFPAGTLVAGLGTGPVRAFERLHRGPIVSLETDAGHRVSCTPNHPVLTPDGWRPAGEIAVGSVVVTGAVGDRHALHDATRGDAAKPIEDIVRALSRSGGWSGEFTDVHPGDFHGDGARSGSALVWTPSGAPTVEDPGAMAPIADPATILAGGMLAVEYVRIAASSSSDFRGRVYNLETPHHFYTAGGIVVHNCVCGPWQRWQPAMASIFERSAQSKLVTLRDLRVFEDSE